MFNLSSNIVCCSKLGIKSYVKHILLRFKSPGDSEN